MNIDKVQLTGQCLDMCPLSERISREQSGRLSIFEMVPGTESYKYPKANPVTCIKEYSRSAAGCKTDDVRTLRPAHVLISTMNFLMNEILNQVGHSKKRWIDIYDFVSDRIRAIRTDLIIQRIESTITAQILIKAVRFHIVIIEKLKDEIDFDKGLCLNHLRSYLSSLSLHSKTLCCEMNALDSEIQLYNVLINFNSTEMVHSIVKNLLLETIGQPFDSKCQLLLQLMSSLSLSNHIQLFRIFENLPYIASCCVSINLDVLRVNALELFNSAYSCKNVKVPIEVVAEWLKFDSPEGASKFCNCTGLKTEEKFVIFDKKIALVAPTSTIQSSWRLLDMKRFKTIIEFVNEGDEY